MTWVQNATSLLGCWHSSCRAWMANEVSWKMTAIFLCFCIRTGSSSDGCFVKTRKAKTSLASLSKVLVVDLVLWVMMHSPPMKAVEEWRNIFMLLFQNRFFVSWMFGQNYNCENLLGVMIKSACRVCERSSRRCADNTYMFVKWVRSLNICVDNWLSWSWLLQHVSNESV